MNRTIKKRREQTFRLVAAGIFAALAYATMLFPHIKIAFLTVDVKDSVIAIASFLLGPNAGCGISLVVAILEMITVSETGPWGALMNFISSAAFACIAAVAYQKRKTVKGAFIGLCIGAISMISSMMVMNLIITPIYTGRTTIEVMHLIPTLLFPFNFAKALLNIALTLLLYKPVSIAVKRANLAIAVNGFGTKPAESAEVDAEGNPVPAEKPKNVNWQNTAMAIVFALVSLTFAAVIYFFMLRGYEISW